MSEAAAASTRRASRWLSREFAELLADPEKASPVPRADGHVYDVLIVGSGYGGAIAASQLAGCQVTTATGSRPVNVAVLERGREFLPGAFPSGLADLPTQLRGSVGRHQRGGEGLFDLRGGSDISVVLANGLGGGSLINAGVMEIPRDAAFDAAWPMAWREPQGRRAWYERAKALLGASHHGVDNTIRAHAAHRTRLPDKAEVLRQLEPAAFREAALTLAMTDGRSSGGVALQACRRCGDCATGCNHGAKESLDTNLLVQAWHRGAEIWCGATALRLQRPPGAPQLWSLLVTHSDETLRRREGSGRWLTARKLILAAGTLGSTELLLRSQRLTPELCFSDRLGQRFSGNGDMIAFGYDYGVAAAANAVADETVPPGERGIGPTITGVVDTVATASSDGSRHRIVIEEMAVPGALRRLVEEAITTANSLQRLVEGDAAAHRAGWPGDDPHAVHRDKIRQLSLFAAMGDDGAGGRLCLRGEARDHDRDGHLAVVWPGAAKLPLYQAQTEHLAQRARDAGFGGRTLANPLWRPLPEAMASLVGDGHGPLLTVHPLGGCPMGDDAGCGVVDASGRVFDTAADARQPLHEGLMVLDGSIIPGALATNPALTIAALALRAVETLRADWGWLPPGGPMLRAPLQRPRVVADTEAAIRERHAAGPARSTEVGIGERLAGRVTLLDAEGRPQDCRVELTLHYRPLPIAQLYRPDAEGRLAQAQLRVDGSNGSGESTLRIFLHETWQQLQAQDGPDEERAAAERRAARCYPVTGTLTLLQREPSSALGRTLRGLVAWLLNRGLRDSAQAFAAWLAARRRGQAGPLRWDRLLLPFKLASHAGEVRRFDYALELGPEQLAAAGAGSDPPRFQPGHRLAGRLRGHKRITYARPSNPWRQLQELQLTELGRSLASRAASRLILDPQYLAARSQPLLRIESQRDHVEALADCAALAGYFLRMLLSIHLWNARKPDAPRPRTLERLPGSVRGLPSPERHEVEVDRLDGAPVHLRLTRYRTRDARADAAPVLLIHGYSASGTTFAHPSLRPGLAPYLARRGRDVWVVDLRSSAGLPWATHPWTFEQIALSDIPAAVDYVWGQTGQRPLDVVAHCMGAAMLGMAVLAANQEEDELQALLRARGSEGTAAPVEDRFRRERRALPQRLRRVVLSQSGPVMVMSQPNIFRAYVMSYCEQLFGPLPYRFRSEAAPGSLDELFDRFLGSLPYPDDELRRENPWQPWQRREDVGTRHRMDALYGRTYSLANLDRRVRAHLDDFFGPLNLDTVAQVIHFARHQVITDRAGRNRFVSGEALRQCWTFPTLSLHGADNGLTDPATLERMRALMQRAGGVFQARTLAGYGHQDCLIGRKAARDVFPHIRDWLDAPDSDPRFAAPAARDDYLALPPWAGPMLNLQADGGLRLSLGSSPALAPPLALWLRPVLRDAAGRWQLHPGFDPRSAAPELLLDLRERRDRDWFSLPLPATLQALGARHLALLLIYPQPGSAGGAFDPGRGDRAAWPPPPEALHRALERATGWSAARPAQRLAVVDLDTGLGSCGAGLSLALGSCQYPAGLLSERVSHRAWERLQARLEAPGESPTHPQLLLLTGDQIYADATAGLFDPTQNADRYRKPYETWLQRPPVQGVLQRLPLLTLPDDHEIDDNWEPLAPQAANAAQHQARRSAGIAAFRRYQRAGVGDPEQLWMSLQAAGLPLFLLDSRTQRQRRSAAGLDGSDLLGEAQWTGFERWLRAAPPELPKLVVSPSLLLPRHRRVVASQGQQVAGGALRSDGWDGYPRSLQRLLALVADCRSRRLVFLSGDEHLGLFSRIRLRGADPGQPPLTLHSIHTAGLNTPYAFANARPSDFILDDHFAFAAAAGPRLHCTLRTAVFEGAGFTLVSLRPDGAQRWTLRCEFDAETGAPAARTVEVAL